VVLGIQFDRLRIKLDRFWKLLGRKGFVSKPVRVEFSSGATEGKELATGAADTPPTFVIPRDPIQRETASVNLLFQLFRSLAVKHPIALDHSNEMIKNETYPQPYP
jgi:hypothetical protein